ncbi:hypothetical protein BAR24066_03261 [Burkholderia arboris]|uniref:Uncharacterized protein n=1 Tax=Burkholderia arboris TaxID=488730 RepID=A0A9Q9SJ04_9BURK|nr:hypothetical protein BAR24066_03261 [Burkholderia arboris]
MAQPVVSKAVRATIEPGAACLTHAMRPCPRQGHDPAFR